MSFEDAFRQFTVEQARREGQASRDRDKQLIREMAGDRPYTQETDSWVNAMLKMVDNEGKTPSPMDGRYQDRLSLSNGGDFDSPQGSLGQAAQGLKERPNKPIEPQGIWGHEGPPKKLYPQGKGIWYPQEPPAGPAEMSLGYEPPPSGIAEQYKYRWSNTIGSALSKIQQSNMNPRVKQGATSFLELVKRHPYLAPLVAVLVPTVLYGGVKAVGRRRRQEEEA